MADSDFWSDLAERFLALARRESINEKRAGVSRIPDQSVRAEQKEWRLVATFVEFEGLARRGGMKIDPAADSLNVWIKTLSKEGLEDSTYGGGVPESLNQEGVQNLFESLNSICRASADLCKTLEARSIETEQTVQIRDSVPESENAGPTSPRGPVASAAQRESDVPQNDSEPRSQQNQPSFVLGTAGFPQGRPTGGTFATSPEIRELVEKEPKLAPLVNCLAQCEQARAEAEVAFRERELTERWAEWSGPYPWDEERDPDTTECPWWVAGAEYVFHVAAAWRERSPGKPEDVERLLPEQIGALADWLYRTRLLAHDIVHGRNANPNDLLGGGNERRFRNVAFLFAVRRFAEKDLSEWQKQAKLLATATTEHVLETPTSPTDALATMGDTGRPRRAPDLESSRERLALVAVLARELAIIKQEVKGYCTVDGLKRNYPKFTLWTLIEDSQTKALVDGEEFTPKAYAENLTLAKFGLTSRETLKKDRRKLRKAKQAGQP